MMMVWASEFAVLARRIGAVIAMVRVLQVARVQIRLLLDEAHRKRVML